MRLKSLLAVNLAAIFSVGGCGIQRGISENNTPSIPVLLQKAKMDNVRKNISISGNAEGNKTVKLGFMVAGKVKYIAGEEGTLIKADQLLASLDSENYSIAKDIADANLDQTQDDYNRLQQMHERKSVSESDFSKISNGLRVAKAQQRLQAKNLSDTKLYSPITGVLLKKGAEVGEIIPTGLPLFVVSDIRTIKINAFIPESDFHNLKLNQKANVHISSLDSSFTGKIVEIGSIADPATRTFSIKIELSNPQSLIRPGMTAEVKLIADDSSEMITIPAEAILHDIDNSSYVYVADPIKKLAFKREVALGKIDGNNIEVISGLQEDDLVVVGGQHKLNNGSLIEVKQQL